MRGKKQVKAIVVFLICMMVLGANMPNVCAEEESGDSGWLTSTGTTVKKNCWSDDGNLNYGRIFVNASTTEIYTDFRPNCKCKFTIYAGTKPQAGSYVSKTHGPTTTEYGISYKPGAKTGYGRVKITYDKNWQ